MTFCLPLISCNYLCFELPLMNVTFSRLTETMMEAINLRFNNPEFRFDDRY